MLIEKEDYQKVHEQFISVVHHQLNQLAIYPSHSFYDDLFQIGQIELYKCAAEFDKDFYQDQARFQFVAFLNKRLRWRLLDEIRRLKRPLNREVYQAEEAANDFDSFDETSSQESGSSEADAFSRFSTREFIRFAKLKLDACDFHFFLNCVDCHGKVIELQRIYEADRQTIVKWKRRLMKNLLPYKHLLISL